MCICVAFVYCHHIMKMIFRLLKFVSNGKRKRRELWFFLFDVRLWKEDMKMNVFQCVIYRNVCIFLEKNNKTFIWLRVHVVVCFSYNFFIWYQLISICVCVLSTLSRCTTMKNINRINLCNKRLFLFEHVCTYMYMLLFIEQDR